MADKRRRRTRAEMERLREVIYETARDNAPLTVRQLFYRLTVAGHIEKTQAEYKNVVVRLSGELRDAGELPFDWIVDSTRWMRKPRTYSSLSSMLEQSSQLYRRDLWADCGTYVEVWCESDSVAGLLYPVTHEWDVPLMVSRGFSSKTYLHDAAMDVLDEHRDVRLFYFRDADPSGECIDRKIVEGLRRYAPEAEFEFERVAVTPEQIEAFDLPSTPPKRTDSRAKSFDGRCVELEALTTGQLQCICEDCITQFVDADRLEQTRRIEQLERQTLDDFAQGLAS